MVNDTKSHGTLVAWKNKDTQGEREWKNKKAKEEKVLLSSRRTRNFLPSFRSSWSTSETFPRFSDLGREISPASLALVYASENLCISSSYFSFSLCFPFYFSLHLNTRLCTPSPFAVSFFCNFAFEKPHRRMVVLDSGVDQLKRSFLRGVRGGMVWVRILMKILSDGKSKESNTNSTLL